MLPCIIRHMPDHAFLIPAVETMAKGRETLASSTAMNALGRVTKLRIWR